MRENETKIIFNNHPTTPTIYSNLTFPKEYITSPLKRSVDVIQAALDDLCLLEENWDGYGASKIEALALEKARIIWRYLADRLPVLPDVVPNPNGTVSFEWESDKGWAHLESGNKTFALYIKPKDAAPISQTHGLPDDESRLLETIEAIRQII